MFLLVTKSVILFQEISTNTIEAPTFNIHSILITLCCNLELEEHEIFLSTNMIVFT